MSKVSGTQTSSYGYRGPLAARGMNCRKYEREAARMEAEAAALVLA